LITTRCTTSGSQETATKPKKLWEKNCTRSLDAKEPAKESPPDKAAEGAGEKDCIGFRTGRVPYELQTQKVGHVHLGYMKKSIVFNTGHQIEGEKGPAGTPGGGEQTIRLPDGNQRARSDHTRGWGGEHRTSGNKTNLAQ